MTGGSVKVAGAGDGTRAKAGPKQAVSCTMVLFGAGGDLTKRLLMPALYNLAGAWLLPDDFKVIGVDRAELDPAA